MHHHGRRLADEVAPPVLEGQPGDFLGPDVAPAREQLANFIAANLPFHQRPLGLVDALVKEEAATDRHPVGAARRLEQALDRGRCQDVIDIHELDPLAPGQRDAPVPIGHQADVRVIDHEPNPPVSAGPGGQQGAGVIRRLVVHHQDVEVGVGLFDDRLQAAFQEGMAVVDRNADRDHGGVHSLRPASALRTNGSRGRIPQRTMPPNRSRSMPKRAAAGRGRRPTTTSGRAQIR